MNDFVFSKENEYAKSNSYKDSDFAIVANNVTKKFGNFTAVDGLNLNAKKGQIHGFLGPNGCGKSTSIRLLTGLLTPTNGDIKVLGLEIPQQAEKLRLNIGYMTQKFSLYEDLTVKENLRFIARIFGMTGQIANEKINKQIEIYNLSQLLNSRPSNMSGGQRQRLSLAVATIHNPDLLFLDEPTSAVDPQSRRDFWEQLFDLCQQGTTILVTTHYMDEAERCHSLAIMQAGKIKASGSPTELMNDIGAHVIEIESENLRELKSQLVNFNEIHSAAQLGMRLRVLIDKSVIEPLSWLKQNVHQLEKNNSMIMVRSSLEDVFVNCTKEPNKK